jgi:hypothetical protein
MKRFTEEIELEEKIYRGELRERISGRGFAPTGGEYAPSSRRLG